MNDLTFVTTTGNLGGNVTTTDNVSGILLYASTLPSADAGVSGFASNDRIKKVFSLADAQALGIKSSTAAFSALAYHVSEYFRLNPTGILYLGIYTVPSQAADYFVECVAMQNFATGEISQFLCYAPTVSYANSQATTLQSVMTTLKSQHAPAVAFLQTNLVGTALSALTTLATLNAPDVQVLIGQDVGGVGGDLAATLGYSVGFGGALMGAVSAKNVGWSSEWLQEFNLSNGTELEVLGFANGVAYTAQAAPLLDTLFTYRYGFLRKHIGVTGSYVATSATAVSGTNDFGYLERSRTMNKVRRLIRATTLSYLSGPLTLTQDGKLSPTTVTTLEELAEKGLKQLLRAGEISDFSVEVPANQPILSTQKVTIVVQMVPLGTARNIEVKLAFVAQIGSN